MPIVVMPMADKQEWQELYDGKEVEMLVYEESRNFVSRLSSVGGSWDQLLFVKGIDRIACCPCLFVRTC